MTNEFNCGRNLEPDFQNCLLPASAGHVNESCRYLVLPNVKLLSLSMQTLIACEILHVPVRMCVQMWLPIYNVYICQQST